MFEVTFAGPSRNSVSALRGLCSEAYADRPEEGHLMNADDLCEYCEMPEGDCTCWWLKFFPVHIGNYKDAILLCLIRILNHLKLLTHVTLVHKHIDRAL